jgi:hypothetical protein
LELSQELACLLWLCSCASEEDGDLAAPRAVFSTNLRLLDKAQQQWRKPQTRLLLKDTKFFLVDV